MKMIMLKIMVMISSTILLLKTPMSMGVMLLTQTMLATLLMSKFMTSSWMAMIVFLMLIGGLLILFMYMSSIASNEKFSNNYKMITMLIMIIVPLEEFLSEMQIEDYQKYFLTQESISMIKIYNKKTLMVTILLFMYLFLTMIAVTSIIKIHKGPLRSK